jgi:GNAT superfamily N-acetyltransferase
MQVIPVIRYCQPEDYEELLPLIKETVSKALPNEEFEEDKIKDLFDKVLLNEEYTGIILLIDGKVAGYVLGLIIDQYFHSKKIAYCLAVYVQEEHRRYGLEMLRSFEAWGKYKGAKTLSISAFKGLSPDKLNLILNKMGYTEQEIAYWKEV